MLEMLQQRIPDGSMRRLVGKCLHVGVLDGEQIHTPDRGTAQGSVLSPVLGNIYLHHVVDTWFEDQIQPRLRGRAYMVRYADDFVMGFQRQDDAERVMAVLGKRLQRYGLSLQSAKTRLISYQRPRKEALKRERTATFDFLGFTWYWRRSRRGHWVPACKTRRVRQGQAIRSVYDWCRRHRHEPIKVQHAALVRRIRGHFNYFGVNGNTPQLAAVVYHAHRAWYKWLNRRSQRARLTWERFSGLLQQYPLPVAGVYVSLWGRVP